ncbi:MAG TPA: hypothetical protein VHB18_07720 [Mycobacteriales bacterium]|nr:hypothetical protein [Mycobacteriales bacterium]
MSVTTTPSRASSARQGTRLATVGSVLWALSPLLLGFTAGPYLWWAYRRLNNRWIAFEAVVAALVTIGGFVLAQAASERVSDGGGYLLCAAMVYGTGRALVLRPRIRRHATPALPGAADNRPDAPTDVAWGPVEARPPAAWDPAGFPATARPASDPLRPDTWATPFDCDGRDHHDLTVPATHTIAYALTGLLSVSLAGITHEYARTLATGIPLLLFPALAAAFRQQIDGPVVTYRTWGVRHTFRLDTATEAHVIARRSRKSRPLPRSLYVAGPDAAKPVRIALGTFRKGGRDARAHLAGWLLRDGVVVDAEVRQLLSETASPAPSSTSTKVKRLRAANILAHAVVITGLVLEVFVVNHGPATSASQCVQDPPANASEVAREYLADLNAGTAKWIAVSNTLRHNDLLTPSVLKAQEEADQSFLASIRTISFPAAIEPLAADYISNVQSYDVTIDAATERPDVFEKLRPMIHRFDQARQSDAAQLRTKLGLPASHCPLFRPR